LIGENNNKGQIYYYYFPIFISKMMNIEKKILILDDIFQKSELIVFVEKKLDEEQAEHMILELKKKIIELLEK